MKSRTTIKQLAIQKGIDPQVVYQRIHYGWSLEDAISTPVSNRRKKRKANDSSLYAKAKKLSLESNVSHSTIYARLRKGDTPELATRPVYSKQARQHGEKTETKTQEGGVDVFAIVVILTIAFLAVIGITAQTMGAN